MRWLPPRLTPTAIPKMIRHGHVLEMLAEADPNILLELLRFSKMRAGHGNVRGRPEEEMVRDYIAPSQFLDDENDEECRQRLGNREPALRTRGLDALASRFGCDCRARRRRGGRVSRSNEVLSGWCRCGRYVLGGGQGGPRRRRFAFWKDRILDAHGPGKIDESVERNAKAMN